MMVLEFTVLLGYDGQLNQSEMEKELFTSAIDQLKDRSDIIFLNYKVSIMPKYHFTRNMQFLLDYGSFYKKAKMTKIENALIWLYVKTWGKFAEHVIEEKDLWIFARSDLETAMMGLAYPQKSKRPERVQDLHDLIMEKFGEGGLAAFRQWSFEIHDQVIVTLPETVQTDAIEKQATTYQDQQHTLVKILKWDFGKYLKSNCKFFFQIVQDG